MKWLICIMIITGCSWSHTDKAMMGIYLAVETVDILQTREIFNNEDYYEVNPILTKDNYIPMMITGTILVYLIADLLPEKWRTKWLGVCVGFKGFLIKHNYDTGIR